MTTNRNSEMPLPIMRGSPPMLIPPKMEWDRPPWDRWAFQNIRQILPAAEVWRGWGALRNLPRDDRAFDELPVTGAQGRAAMANETARGQWYRDAAARPKL